jgi:glycosyltransferase involved in cell wall biosynthesis
VTGGLQAAEAVVAPTRFMLDALKRHYGPLATGRVIPNGFTSERGISKCVKEPFVFAAGRWWDEAKNVAALAQVAPRICWPIKIAGLPSPRSGHTESPPGVENLGRLNAAEMHEQYRRASIYCLPARYEPFGLTPLEAASAGCALVLGELPSLQEVWGDAAIYVPPDDEAAIADALNRLIPDEGRRNDLARRGQARALKYSRTRMAEAYMKLYRELQEERIEHVSRTMAGGLR